METLKYFNKQYKLQLEFQYMAAAAFAGLVQSNEKLKGTYSFAAASHQMAVYLFARSDAVDL